MSLNYQEEVSFATIPPIEVVCERLAKLTGLEMKRLELEKGGWSLHTEAEAGLEMAVGLLPLDDMYVVSGNALHKYNDYLLYSLLYVLIELGGRYGDVPFPWQGKTWVAFKQEWNPIYVISPTM